MNKYHKWHSDGSRIYAQDNPGGKKVWIADVSADSGLAIQKQHARLIATAPLMLCVLESTLDMLDNLTTEEFNGGADVLARQAIHEVIVKARATGSK